MDIKKLQALVIDALEDVKAQDILVFDTSHLTSLFDRIAIASGTSNRQTKALASSVRDKVKAAGGHILSIEGEGTGEWVLVDLGDMIVHVMQPAIRAYYRLEEIWGEKEIKLGAAKRVATASKNAASAEPRKISRHLTTSQAEAVAIVEKPQRSLAKKTPARPARKTAAKTAGKTAGKTASKTAAKSPAKKVVAKKAIVKKVAVKKTASKTVAAKKTAVKKPRVSAAKTTAAKPKAKAKVKAK
jgi:ribosome-associated protein